MSDILVRGLNAEAVNRLKARAKRHRRSLQGEAKILLEQAAGVDSGQVIQMLDKWKKNFAGRRLARSADLIRGGRER